MLFLSQIASSDFIHLGLKNVRFGLFFLLPKAVVFAQEGLRQLVVCLRETYFIHISLRCSGTWGRAVS